ncbi:MAG: PAS domain S-box protein [Deltaproteobacteria bacterium]|nr:PAS domain S-box protein [Deltaproteobacteria bacterium]
MERLSWWIGGIGVVVALGIAARMVLRGRAMTRMRELAQRIAAGDFAARLAIGGRGELGRLARAINDMRASLELQFLELTAERNRLRTMVHCMAEGVAVTDARGEITLINPAFHQLVGIECAYEGRNFAECFRLPELHEAVREILHAAHPRTVTLAFTVGGETRHLEVHVAPLRTVTQRMGAVVVVHDITALHRVEELRKEFVANVSHELKTPLTNIRGYAETLRQGAAGDPAVAERFLRKIKQNAEYLQALVEDLLRLSECESGRLALQPIPIPLAACVADLLADLADRARNKRIDLRQDIPPGLAVLADPAALRQILGNLIENAVKYTPNDGTVHVLATGPRAADAFCTITIRDTGSGIAPDDLPRIFERFYRVEKSRSRELGGTGLGLAIVKHLVQAHGGDVTVQSTPGQGSSFSLILPAATARERVGGRVGGRC